jgi:hypothetical protein
MRLCGTGVACLPPSVSVSDDESDDPERPQVFARLFNPASTEEGRDRDLRNAEASSTDATWHGRNEIAATRRARSEKAQHARPKTSAKRGAMRAESLRHTGLASIESRASLSPEFVPADMQAASRPGAGR